MRIVRAMTLQDDGRPALSPPISGTALVNVCALLLFVVFLFPNRVERASERFAAGMYQTPTTEGLENDLTLAPPPAGDIEPNVALAADRGADRTAGGRATPGGNPQPLAERASGRIDSRSSTTNAEAPPDGR